MIRRPVSIGAFEFSVIAGLRAEQLARGCTPRVSGSDKKAVIAQLEVATSKVVRAVAPIAALV